MEIGIFEIVVFTGVVIGAYHWGRMSMLTDIVKELKAKGVIPENLGQSKVDNEDEDEVIKVEKHQGLIYAFGSNDKFLGQGATYDDLFSVIKQRYPGQNFRVQKDGIEDAEFEKMVTSIFKTFGDKNDKNS